MRFDDYALMFDDEHTMHIDAPEHYLVPYMSYKCTTAISEDFIGNELKLIYDWIPIVDDPDDPGNDGNPGNDDNPVQDGSSNEAGISIMYVAAGGIGVLALAGVAFFLIRRR